MSLDNYQGHRYNKTGTVNDYELVAGVYLLPVAESEDTTDPTWSPVDLIQAHAPYRIRTLQFRAEKHASPPLMPAPADTGAFKFLGGNLAFMPPRVDANGGHLTWGSYGDYTFVENCRSSLSDGFVLGLNLPFATTFQQGVSTVGENPAQYGAISQAGNDARLGFVVGQQLSMTDPAYSYDVPSFVPAVFFDQNMANGQADLPTQTQPPQTYPPNSFIPGETELAPPPRVVKPPVVPRRSESPC